MAKKISIRTATEKDVGLILHFIESLADYERLRHEVVASEKTLNDTLFCENPSAYVIIGELDGVPSGFALYFYNYSTFLAKPGIFLEDLYVNEESRGSGLGKALLIYLAKKAKAEKCGRFEWNVLDWNKPAIDFYTSIGAKPTDEWTGYRLDEWAISKIA